jgi:hypothetical protein
MQPARWAFSALRAAISDPGLAAEMRAQKAKSKSSRKTSREIVPRAAPHVLIEQSRSAKL